MAKRIKADPTETEPKADQSSSVAILKTHYETLVGKVASTNDSMDTARQRKSELVANAVENQKLHKGAFAWVMRLRKMDPVKRNEFLFHFDVYCDYEQFGREDLLPDRGDLDVNGVERGIDEDGEEDLRPTHLRQPGASAAGIVQDLAAKTGAKTSDEDNILKIGRGKAN